MKPIAAYQNVVPASNPDGWPATVDVGHQLSGSQQSLDGFAAMRLSYAVTEVKSNGLS